MILFACPRCETKLNAKPDQAGNKFSCPKCGQRLQVPSPPPDCTVIGRQETARSQPQTFVPATQSIAPTPLVTFLCPNCQGTLNAPQDKVGAFSKCPLCSFQLQIPRLPVYTQPAPDPGPGNLQHPRPTSPAPVYGRPLQPPSTPGSDEFPTQAAQEILAALLGQRPYQEPTWPTQAPTPSDIHGIQTNLVGRRCVLLRDAGPNSFKAGHEEGMLRLMRRYGGKQAEIVSAFIHDNSIFVMLRFEDGNLESVTWCAVRLID